jgi:hypothetical protein
VQIYSERSARIAVLIEAAVAATISSRGEMVARAIAAMPRLISIIASRESLYASNLQPAGTHMISGGVISGGDSFSRANAFNFIHTSTMSVNLNLHAPDAKSQTVPIPADSLAIFPADMRFTIDAASSSILCGALVGKEVVET